MVSAGSGGIANQSSSAAGNLLAAITSSNVPGKVIDGLGLSPPQSFPDELIKTTL